MTVVIHKLFPLVLLAALLPIAACDDEEPDDGHGHTHDASSDTGSDVGLDAAADAATTPDLVATDGAPDTEAADTGAADTGSADSGDGGGAAFTAINPCPRIDSYVAGVASVATAPNRYNPPCLRVPAGTSVVIEATTEHPLEARPLGTTPNPIPTVVAATSVSFPMPGFYAYHCPEHFAQGMLGVIWVTAAP